MKGDEAFAGDGENLFALFVGLPVGIMGACALIVAVAVLARKRRL